MSGKTVGQVVNQDLLSKLESNGQLANLVMGIVGKVVWECARRTIPVNGVTFGEVFVNTGDFTFSIHFSRIAGPYTGLVNPQSTVRDYIAAKSENLSRCVDANPGFAKLIEDFVRKVDSYCRHKNVDFVDWRVEKAFLTPSDVMVIKSAKTLKGRWE